MGHRDVVLAGDDVGVLLFVDDSTRDVEDGDPGAVDPWRSRPDLLVADDPRRERPLVGLPYTPSNNSDKQRSDKRWLARPTGRAGLKGAGVSANPDPASTAAKRGAQPRSRESRRRGLSSCRHEAHNDAVIDVHNELDQSASQFVFGSATTVRRATRGGRQSQRHS
ncbi:hypothetical protein RH858_14095 [Halalkaliarchaeum sp. AArc-GB]|uniref:hypothetical protein n=1 Tax=Halalkaliarchaeum sp. AArc-GB TaxID=3074078 RepID=UPI002861437E|nr:hypothetical protein [Halalkaliarchaeum sp. AArc-GB]MDR5674256.1 hypothetical protein [Halalkaliarchaeum sp. AArc-GB]